MSDNPRPNDGCDRDYVDGDDGDDGDDDVVDVGDGDCDDDATIAAIITIIVFIIEKRVPLSSIIDKRKSISTRYGTERVWLHVM